MTLFLSSQQDIITPSRKGSFRWNIAEIVAVFCSFNSDRESRFGLKSQACDVHFDSSVNFAPPRLNQQLLDPVESSDPEKRVTLLLSDEVSTLNGGHLTWQPTLQSAFF